MRKRIFSFFLAFTMIFCFIPLSALADEHTHSFENKRGVDLSNLPDDYSIPVTIYESPCSNGCGKSEYSWNVFGIAGQFVDTTGLPGLEVYKRYQEWFQSVYGKNATSTKFAPGGGSAGAGGVGRKDILGYDDNNSALVSNDGMQRVRATFKFFLNYDSDKQPIESFTIGKSSFYAVGTPGQVILTSENTSDTVQFSGGYFPVQQLPGYYTLPAGTEVYNFNYYQGTTNYPQTPTIISKLSGYGRASNYKNFYISSTETNVYFFYVNDYSHENEYSVNSSNTAGFSRTYTFKGYGSGRKILIAPHDIYLDYTPDTSSTNLRTYTQYNITNNNITNKWNGRIYVDNSTNVTYIYPQYTTINDAGETITNISNNPIKKTP